MSSPLTKARQQVAIGDYLVDVFVSEEHALDSDVTQYPVEDGSDITDNVRPKPRTITIEGFVSDTPVGQMFAYRSQTSGNTTVDSVSTPQGSIDGSAPALDYLPSEECFEFLEELYESREPVRLVTVMKVYDQVVLASLSIPIDAETGAALGFTATFQVLRLVTNARTTVRVAAPPAAAKVNQGNKPTGDRVLVNRLVDPNTGAWFDPDMPNPNGGKGRWRYGAQPLPDGTWNFSDGPATLSDADEQGGLVSVHKDKATGETIVNPSQQLVIVNAATGQSF